MAGLPEGVTKEVITAAPVENSKRPKAGDEVTVHYVGTLATDGQEFDSSRARDKPFNFTLGQGAVIKGWDVGVATMKKGEVSRFTLAPDFAYGASGSPPKIPANATLVFEIELLSWIAKDDLFQDGGMIRTLLTPGTGWKEPKFGDEVRCSVKVTALDGSLIDDRPSFDYVLGSGVLGMIARAVDKALSGMKQGESWKIDCNKDYAYGDRGAVMEITLEQIYEIRDVSFDSNGTMLKKQVKEGEGWDMPKESCKVKLRVEAATDGKAPLPGFEARTLEFIACNGEVCDAVECAVCEMKKGELAEIKCYRPERWCVDDNLKLKVNGLKQVNLRLELLDFEKGQDTWQMSDAEKVEYATAGKDVGGNLFRKGRIDLALQRYKKVVDLLNYLDGFKDEEAKGSATSIKKACLLNRAACQLKLQKFKEAKETVDGVLKDEPQNVKALFRSAQAELGLGNFLECIHKAKKVLELDPQCREARVLLKDANVGQKEVDKKSRDTFSKMCAGLGKGPIPEPYKDRRFEKPANETKADESVATEASGNGTAAEEKAAQ